MNGSAYSGIVKVRQAIAEEPDSLKTLSIVVVTNVAAPYRMELFRRVYTRVGQFQLVLQSTHEPGRNWDPLPKESFDVRVLPSRGYRIGRRRIVVNTGLGRVIREALPDVVVSAGFSSISAALAWYGLRRKLKLVLMNDGTCLTDPIRGPEFQYRRLLVRQAAGFIAASRESKEYLHMLGATESSISIVELTRDLVELRTRGRDIQERFECRRGLGVGDKVICFVGKLVENKRPEDAIRAVAAATRELGDLWLLIAGEGPLRPQLEREAAQHGLENVRFLGLLKWEELKKVYLASDLMLFPAVKERFGMVIIEALASGVPVIATTGAGATADLLCDGVNGFVISPGDIGGMKDRIVRFFRETALAGRLREEAFGVVDRHDITVETENFLTAIRRVASMRCRT